MEYDVVDMCFMICPFAFFRYIFVAFNSIELLNFLF